MTKTIKIISGIAAAILFIIVVAFYATSGLTGVIKAQLSAIESGDIAKAYQYTSNDFQNATSLEDFTAFVDSCPAIKDNARASFTSREVNNDIGTVKGTLYSNDGTATPIEYRLIREDGKWKILGIEVQPSGISEDKPSQASIEESNKPVKLTKTFDNTESRYSIKYPENWEYEKAGQGTIILSGKKGTPSYFSTINIQTVLTKKTGGEFSTTKNFIADLKKQAKAQSPGIKFIDSGAVTVNDQDGSRLKGEFAVFVYKYKNQEFKQWQIVVLRGDNQVFYAWAYTSPIEQYNKDEEIAKKMLATWTIY